MSAVGLSLSHNLGAFPVLVVLATSAATAFAQVPKEPQKPASLAAKPPWQRVLTVDAAIKVEDLEKKIAEFERKGEFAASLAPARQVVEIRRGGQGQDHWQTVEAMVKAEAWALVASADERRQSRLAAAIQRISAAHELTEKQRYAEAEPLFSKVEDTDLSLLGKGNWISITIDLDMGVIRRAQGRYEEAESLLRKGLAIASACTARTTPTPAPATTSWHTRCSSRESTRRPCRLRDRLYQLRNESWGRTTSEQPTVTRAWRSISTTKADMPRPSRPCARRCRLHVEYSERTAWIQPAVTLTWPRTFTFRASTASPARS